MTTCHVHDDANSDLDELFAIDEAAAATTFVLLEELFENKDLAEKLYVNNEGRYLSPDFHNLRVSEFWAKGYSVFRLKYHDGNGSLVGYRILHAYHGVQDCSYILAIADRKHAYDTSHAKVIRLFETYHSLGIYWESR